MIWKDIFVAVQRGRELTNAAVWANRSQAGALLIAFLSAVVAVAKGLGYELPIDDEQISNLAFGVVSIVAFGAWLLRTLTDKRAGLPTKPGSAAGPDDQS